MDINSSELGVNHFEVTFVDASSISIKEVFTNHCIHKTEITLNIKNISAETILQIITEIDKENF